MVRFSAALFAAVAFSASAAFSAGLTVIPMAPSGTPSVVPSAGFGSLAFGPLTDATTASIVVGSDDLFKDKSGANQVVPGVSPVSTFDSANAATGGLFVTGTGTITVTYLGKEAGFFNQASEMGVAPNQFRTTTSVFGDSFSFDVAGGTSLVDFEFGTYGFGPLRTAKNGGPIDAPLLLSFTNVFDGTLGGKDTSAVIAFFEDKNFQDLDIDDMLVRFDFTPIPLPAAAWMFFAAIGGLGVIGRRRAVAAAA